MATVKLFLEEVKKDGTCALTFLLTHDRRKKKVATGIHLFPIQWDSANQTVIKHEFKDKLNSVIAQQRSKIMEVFVDALIKPVTVDTLKDRVKEALSQKPSYNSLKAFTEKLCKELESVERAGNAESYRTAVRQLTTFTGGDIYLNQIDYTMLRSFSIYKQTGGCKSNSIRAYLAGISAIWNEANNRGILKGVESPFKRGLIPPVQKTKKKAIAKLYINILEQNRESLFGNMRLAVDCALLMFYFRGMTFSELALLRPSNINGDYIEFNRYKNRSKKDPSFATVKIIDKARVILNEYRPGKYLLPLFEGIDLKKEYMLTKHKRKSINQSLRYVSKRLNIATITPYVIRHTWITVANQKTDKFHLVCYAANHSLGKMTEVYIKYNQEEIDQLNDLVCHDNLQLHKTIAV